MNLKFLVISDTHLGEETSLLCFPHGRRRLWSALCEIFGGGHPGVQVEELILLGDIPDRTLSSTSQIITHTNALMETLGSALDVRRAVYLPGNHDHTIWSSYLRDRSGAGTGITAVDGETLVSGGKIVPGLEGAADPLLSLFFGHPDGSPWRAVEAAGKLDFVVANPIYARAFQGRTYVFTHGTHFRKDVAAPVWLKTLLDAAAIDELLAELEIQPGGNVARAKDLADLEAKVTPFVDSLWPSSGSNPTGSSDQLWYLLTYISGKFGHRRDAPLKDMVFDRAALAALGEGERLVRLTPEHDLAADEITPVKRYANGSIERLNRIFLKHALAEAQHAGLPAGPVTFVYGDTHEGGYGRLPNPAGGGDVRVYNTGSWVVHNERHHPPCHLFAVDEAGNEYMVDLTFGGVTVDGRSLLDLAAEDAENRKRATSIALRAILSLVPTPH
jgi:hypothetical protein